MKRLLIIIGFSLIVFFSVIAGRYAYIRIKYPIILENIASERIKFMKAYESATSDGEKEEVIGRARNYLNKLLPGKIFPAWYGTPWSYNGNSGHPLQGSIACGSFVEHVLKHAGFDIDDRMSVQPSEYIIMNICEDHDIARFSNASIDAFNEEVQSKGEGLYIVGLDHHVGFLCIYNGKYRFVHSHGYLFVLSEIPSLSPMLRRSKYRVVGKLFSDRMIEQWLYGRKIPAKYNYFQQNQ